MKKADVGVAAYIVAAFVMLIVPIPSWLLDVLLACNIAIAFTILFTTMFSKEVLDMSFFPTILLFTTIFRIALNVSSTRLILTTGDPGQVVATFGSFVGGGDLIVGAIVFLILLIVQFMVINKGSERVAEVTARFTLDAMPGKQMAIDADLNTGAINDAEAKRRRDKIQEEASFFGSMDGAVKYVKGDATAGLIITAVNVIGGIAMGVLRQNMDITAALNKYVILTIGDGLVSQIPSLLTFSRYSGYEGIEGCRLWYGTDQTVIRCTKSLVSGRCNYCRTWYCYAASHSGFPGIGTDFCRDGTCDCGNDRNSAD